MVVSRHIAAILGVMLASVSAFVTRPVVSRAVSSPMLHVAKSRAGSAAPAGRRFLAMGLFDVLRGGGSKGIDYSQLTGLASREAAEYAKTGVVTDKTKDGWTIATFGGGCFWGVELAYQRVPGVIDTSVGYTQGKMENPTYDDVCSGMTGHTEVVQVFYNPKEVTFENLCQVLLNRIDPTLPNQVGNDRGTQYRHGIYYHNAEQEKGARAVLAKAQEKYKKPVVTEVKPAMVYWPAEEYHQKYLSTGGRFGMGQSAAKGCNDPIRCYG